MKVKQFLCSECLDRIRYMRARLIAEGVCEADATSVAIETCADPFCRKCRVERLTS